MKKILMFIAVFLIGSQVGVHAQSQLEDNLILAEAGHAPSQGNVGLIYEQGIGVPQNYVEAVRWYRLSSEQGYALSQVALGSMYNDGRGVPEDDVVAYMWFNLAGAQGVPDVSNLAQDYKAEMERQMTREQIAEAQRMTREWIARHPPE